MGVTSAGKPGGCRYVRTSDVLEGSPECAGVCRACTVHAGKHGKCMDIVEIIQKVWECAGVHQSAARPGMCQEVESAGKP